MARPRQRARHQPLPLEVVHGEGVGGHHDHHRDVEGEQRAEHEEVLVVHLAHPGPGHHVLHVEDGEEGDGRGEEQPQPPGQRHLVQDRVLALGPLPQRPPDPSVPTCRRKYFKQFKNIYSDYRL